MNDIDWRTLSLPGIDGSTVAIVLGGGGAIGGETVRALAAMGATVAAPNWPRRSTRSIPCCRVSPTWPSRAIWSGWWLR
jgi:hypothetical protein